MPRARSKPPIPRLSCLLLALGCASPSQPKPPSLHLPAPATALTAQRLADQVILTWNTPSNTTDGESIRTPITARICRQISTNPPSSITAPCTPLTRILITPGHSAYTDTLPTALLTDPPHLLAYRIELLNPKDRFAPTATIAYAATGIAPPPTGQLTIQATRAGATVTWPIATSTKASMELQRTELKPASLTPKPKSSIPGKKEPATTRLRGPELPDPGGVVDKSVQPLATYTYTAQRVRTLVLSGQTLELRGLPSPAATFTYRNTIPPTAPTGLNSVLSGGFAGAPTIDLSWEPNPEPDLESYNLYRSDNGAPFIRLNPAPIPGPAYRDTTAQPNHQYTYRVTALDQNGNESPPSPEIKDHLRN